MEAEYSEKTPEERAAVYAKQQLEIYQNFLDSFKEDQAALELPFDFADKQMELETKFKKEEAKKLEKQTKKDINEWEDFYGAPGYRTSQQGLNTLGDKLTKIMKDSLGKALKRHNGAISNREQQLTTRDTVIRNYDTCIKQRKMLEGLCKTIFQKNHDLYLKHERMLDEEKKLRSELG
mmetsp:Transcript_25000/g.31235  ORF Transcript_25000/g.31235 Transcript_25000/m.31235 type:complete len:178 (+) Transcript_25000:319-852(+)